MDSLIETHGQEFLLWAPVPNAPASFSFQSLNDEEDGLHIILRADNERRLEIIFQQVIAYRLILRELDIGFWISFAKTETEISGKHFFEVKHSNWIRSLLSGNITCNREMLHYLILTEEERIEIICSQTPSAAWAGNFFGDAA